MVNNKEIPSKNVFDMTEEDFKAVERGELKIQGTVEDDEKPKYRKTSKELENDKAAREAIKKAEEIGRQKSRIFWIMQYYNHPITGEQLFCDEWLHSGLDHKTIKRYAYAIHDKDVFHDFDAPYKLDENGERIVARDSNGVLLDEVGEPYYVRDLSFVGKPKSKHIHIALEMSQAYPLASIAKWFHLPLAFVKMKKGAGTFLDLTEYLTHEAEAQQEKGKHRYDDKEIHVSRNFKDWREQLDKRNMVRLEYGEDLTTEQFYKSKVFRGEMTVRDVIALAKTDIEVEKAFTGNADYEAQLYKMRGLYLKGVKPPESRINYYMTGNGGSGKGLLAKALARSLYPALKDDRDIFFEVGQKANLFDSYDGQPVIIWNDWRGKELKRSVGGRGDFLNIFESHPTYTKVNKKFGETALVNVVNIVNSVQEPIDFVNDIIAAEVKADGTIKEPAEDPGQVFRRFPVFIFVDTESYQMFVSQGFLDSSEEYSAYVSEERFRQDLRGAISAVGSGSEIYLAEEKRTVKPITDKHAELLNVENKCEFESVGGEVMARSHASLDFGKSYNKTSDNVASRQSKTNINIDDDVPF